MLEFLLKVNEPYQKNAVEEVELRSKLLGHLTKGIKDVIEGNNINTTEVWKNSFPNDTPVGSINHLENFKETSEGRQFFYLFDALCGWVHNLKYAVESPVESRAN